MRPPEKSELKYEVSPRLWKHNERIVSRKFGHILDTCELKEGEPA
jgi:hypothetical protein